eukprot:TRINITY_DN3172_c0_g1_i4.p1 TRINITY_DN3172_c0_g1~~TRINITY_DN3172_c0_g1_i4.p1  ORF type:complete len:693 (+),score=107.68 TRINITY_DN3172_c0_g1_i4:54-2132(+)
MQQTASSMSRIRSGDVQLTASDMSRIGSSEVQKRRTSMMGIASSMSIDVRETASAVLGIGGGDVQEQAGKATERDFSTGISAGQPPRASCGAILRAIARQGVPYFVDRKTRLKAFVLAVLIGTFIWLEVKTTVDVAHAMKDVSNAILDKSQAEFKAAFLEALGIMARLAPSIFVWKGAAEVLHLSWRRYLTENAFAKYIDSDQSFYRLKMQYGNLDNPDQRIAQDIDHFTKHSVRLVTRFVEDILKVILNAVALFAISPILAYALTGFCIGYTLIVLCCFVSPLMRVERRILAVEADLRYVLVRLREHAESIAFFRGADVERLGCEVVLDGCITANYKKAFINTVFYALSGIIYTLAPFIPILVVAPMYFNGQVQFGTIHEAQTLFNHLLKGMMDFGKEMDDMAKLGAEAVRVQELWDALESVHNTEDDVSTDTGGSSDEERPERELNDDGDIDDNHDGIRVVSVQDLETEGALCLRLEEITLYPPFGSMPLMRDVSLSLYRGQSLLIEGPSGSGKSSLLRAIGGLFSRGHGRVSRKCLERSFFLPQSAYLCLGSLRDNLLYPKGNLDHQATDEELCMVLQTLKIGHLADRHGLDTPIAFESILSGGEKQRLNFARLLLRKDLEFALLDEATSALDEENEQIAYGLVQNQVPCYVSVGHRPQLAACHSNKLVLEKTAQGGCRGTLMPSQVHM